MLPEPRKDVSPEAVGEGQEPGLAKQAAGGVVWQGLSYVLSKIVVLGTTVVLARLLSPRELGVFAIALVFITYSEHLADLGVAQALVFLPRDDRTIDAALLASLGISLTLVAIAFAIAPLVGDFFNRDDVVLLFRVLSLSLLLRGTGHIPDALLRKDLRFRQRLKAEFSRAFVMAVVSISLAVAGLGIWAIVGGYLAGDLAWNVVAWRLVDYRPRLRFWKVERESFRPLIRFGVPAAGQGVLLTLVYDIDYLIVGRVLGSISLGYYTVAYRIPQSTIIPAFWALSAVAFPMFSRVQDDPARLRRGYLAWMRLQTAVGVAAGVGLAVLAPMVVNVFFGERWAPAIVPLQALALYTSLRSLTSGVFDLYKGIGRPVLAFWLSAVRLAVVIPVILYGTRFGIAGVSWGQVIAAFVLAVIMQGVALRVLQLPLGDFIRSLKPATAIGIGTALGAGAIRLWMPGAEAIRLGVGAVAAATVGLALLHLADRTFLADLTTLFRRRTSVSPKASTA